MRSRFLDAYNAVNILRNGGLDFDAVSGDAPPFWEIENASVGAVPPKNSFSVVKGETPESEIGAANYLRFVLVSDDVVELKYDFRERFQDTTAGKIAPPWWQSRDVPQTRIPEGYNVLESQLIRGIDVTVAFSVRAKQGSVRVELEFDYSPNPPVKDTVVVYDALASSEWVRPSTVVHVGSRRVNYLSIKIKRASSGSADVHVGCLAMAKGSFFDLPYTGDPAAEAIPKGAIVMAFGNACPPGYQKMSFASPPKFGRIFPMTSATPSDDISGSEEHDHSEATMTMNPENDWPVIELVPTPHDQSYGVRADDGSEVHQHGIVKADNVPPSKDVILCKRL